MIDLAEEGRRLVSQVTTPPTPLERLRHRSRRRRRRQAIGAGVAVVVAVVGVLTGVGQLGGGRSSDVAVGGRGRPAKVAVPARPASAASDATALDWGPIRLWLPPSWTPSAWTAHCRSQGFSELSPDQPYGIGLAPCHYPKAAGSALTVRPFHGPIPPGGRTTAINGIPVVEIPASGATKHVVVPSLETQLVAKTSAAAAVLSSLQHSVAWDIAHSPPPRRPAGGWKTVTYRQITIDVPTSWHLLPVGYGICSREGGIGGGPQVMRGEPTMALGGCPAGVAGMSPIPTPQGVAWIDPGSTAERAIGPAVTVTRRGLRLSIRTAADTPAEIVVHVTGSAHGTIEIEVGNHPNLAAAILGSIR